MSAPTASPSARAEGAGDDRSVCAFFSFRTRACGRGTSGGSRAGPDEHSHAERLVAHGDLPDGLPREMLLAGSGLERDLFRCKARQTTGGPHPRCVVDQKPIIEVDPKRKVLEQAGLTIDGAQPSANGTAILRRSIDSPHPGRECPDGQPDAGADRGGAEAVRR